jgi:TonB-linked SusC/RagA family outer membrane protein
MISRQTGDSLLYSSGIFSDWPGIRLNLIGVSIRTCLDSCFAGTNIRYVISGKNITLSREPFKGALYQNLRGRVINEAEGSVPGASLSIPGKDPLSLLAHDDGSFSIPMNDLETVVTISCKGYVTQSFRLSNKHYHDHDIVLRKEVGKLEEVVVQGYLPTRKKDLTIFVANLTSADIKNEGPNVMGVLQWRVPGLYIQQENGVPGSASTMRSRGQHAIWAGNDPLIIVDGVNLPARNSIGVIGPGSPLGVDGASPLNGIAPEDIDTINVLNGAAATSVYGSKGANGVIQFTLKKGHSGRLEVKADLNFGKVLPGRMSPLLNTAQFLQVRREAIRNDSAWGYPSSFPELDWDTSRYTNFQRQVVGKTTGDWNGRVELTGGGANSYFLLSATAHEQSTPFMGESRDSRRYVYGNLHILSPDHRLQLSFSGAYGRQSESLPQSDLTRGMLLAPHAPPFTDPNNQPVWSYNNISFLNLPALTRNRFNLGVYNLLGHLQVKYQVAGGFSLEGSGGFYHLGASEQGMTTIAGQDPSQSAMLTGSLYLGSHRYLSGNAELLGRYSGMLGKGELNMVMGGTLQRERRDSSANDLSGFASDLQLVSGNGAPTSKFSRDRIWYYYSAFFSQGTYTFDKRYILTASARRDGSSRWSKSNQYGIFWSLGGAWKFSEEAFFKRWKALSFGKIRGSWGTAGNDQISDFQFSQVYTSVTAAGGQQGFLPNTLYNPALQWERYVNKEAGLDLGFLGEKIVFSVVAYRSCSQTQLIRTNIAGQAGEPGILATLPIQVRNDGLEFSLQTSVGKAPGLQWVSVLNLTLPRSRLDRFPGLANSAYATSFVVGSSPSVSKGPHFTHVGADSGLYRFADRNGDSVLDRQDYVNSKSRDPRCYGAWSNRLSCGPWELEIVAGFTFQNTDNPFLVLDLLNLPGAGTQAPSQLSNGPVEWLTASRWHQPGDHAAFQRFTALQQGRAHETLNQLIGSDAARIDGSYGRIKTVALSWKLPENLLKAWHMQRCVFYVRGHNLWTITRFPIFDPETPDVVLPPTKSWECGFSITF